MTFVNLAKRIRVAIGAGIDKVTFLRDAENDFIEKTLCTETYTGLSTSTLNGGTLTNLYDLPAGFIKEHRVEWDGRELKPVPQGTQISLYDTNGNLYTGTPALYWIENEDIQLIPKPSYHGTIGLWYTGYNTSDTVASPIIPTIEHIKLINKATADILEMMEQEKRAAYYLSKYNADVADAARKYDRQRTKQGTIIDIYDDTYRYGLPMVTGVITVQETNIVAEYTWRRVALANYDAYPPTEETFTVGSGKLASLSSAQLAIPVFSSTATFIVQTTRHQDRDCIVTTLPAVSSGVVTFGLTLSDAGVLDTACYFDITLKQLS